MSAVQLQGLPKTDEHLWRRAGPGPASPSPARPLLRVRTSLNLTGPSVRLGSESWASSLCLTSSTARAAPSAPQPGPQAGPLTSCLGVSTPVSCPRFSPDSLLLPAAFADHISDRSSLCLKLPTAPHCPGIKSKLLTWPRPLTCFPCPGPATRLAHTHRERLEGRDPVLLVDVSSEPARDGLDFQRQRNHLLRNLPGRAPRASLGSSNADRRVGPCPHFHGSVKGFEVPFLGEGPVFPVRLRVLA